MSQSDLPPSTPPSPSLSEDEEGQMKLLLETVKPKDTVETSVAAWLLQDLNSHKERLIKGQNKLSLINSPNSLLVS
jgi:hypothetical protein